jgi:hypothetical protein
VIDIVGRTSAAADKSFRLFRSAHLLDFEKLQSEFAAIANTIDPQSSQVLSWAIFDACRQLDPVEDEQTQEGVDVADKIRDP